MMKSQIFIPNIFQSEALKEIDKAMLEDEKAFLIVMPTATGKTYLAAQWFKFQLKKNPKARLLYVCHNQDILSQANDKEFAHCLSEFDIPRGYYNKSEKNVGQVTFATVQTLRRNLDKLPSDYFDYIIVDEAHHYRANSFEMAIKHFTPKVLLGLTATPYRMDGKSILDVFGKIIYNVPISRGIKNGLLSKIKYYFVDNDIDFSEIKRDKHGMYDEKDLNKKLCIKEYDDAIIKEYTETIKQKHNRKKTICFCATVEHVYRMEKLFNDNGINAIALAAKHYGIKGKEVTVHDSRRKQIIDKFKNGDYDIIFVRDLFNEGIDVPNADCIMMLRPTESSRIFTQQIGRGLRVSKEKNYLLTLDFTGNCYRCDINYEVLNEIMEIDIVKDVIEKIRKIRNNNPQEIIIQNLGCDIRLNKKVINIIKELDEKIITEEKLIENYYNVKKELNKAPRYRDMHLHGRFDGHQYTKIFGSWIEFLEKIGEEIKWGRLKTKLTEDDLIKNYYNVKKELNKIPTTTEMNTYGKFVSAKYVKIFGSWYEFLEKIGEEIKYRKITSKVTEEDLIKNYWDLKNKYPNKYPCLISSMVTKENGSRFDLSTYYKHFGSWNKFLAKIGEKVSDMDIISEITDDELIENYWNLKNKFDYLNSIMVNKRNGSRFSIYAYTQRFGSWNKFLETIGESPEIITDDELIENYWNLKNKYPYLKSGMVHKDNGRFSIYAYTQRFGSWNKFLETIGEIPEITDEDLIKNYWDLKNKYPNLASGMVLKKNGSRFNKHIYDDRFGSWNKFLEKMGEKINHRIKINEEELIKNYWELKNKIPNLTSSMVTKENGSQFDISTYYRHFGNWTKFLEIAGEKSYIDENKKNITFIQDYTPKNPLPDLKFGKSDKKSRIINPETLLGHKYNGSIDKDNIRYKIIEKIQDGDTVLILESPKLDALKEIEKQGKNPKKIIIPNHFEFDDLATALRQYNTNLNIEVINTSVLQYLADHSEENFNFLWLDYQGAFSYYGRDLDIVFQRKIIDMRLILTYNVFDPRKQDDGYYFTNVIGYVLKKLRGKNEILLMEDISKRYKKNMFSVGFDIKNLMLH